MSLIPMSHLGCCLNLAQSRFAYQMHGSVTAPTTECDFGFFIVHGFLQVLEELTDTSCIRSVGAPRVLCEYDFQPQGLQMFVRAFHERCVNLAGLGETMTRSLSCTSEGNQTTTSCLRHSGQRILSLRFTFYSDFT